MADTLVLGGHEFQSRFILGSGKYNMKLIKAAVEQGGAQIITLALRRANTQEKESILDFIPEGVTLLPNTSGARNAEEAIRIARLSRAMRQVGAGDFSIRLETSSRIREVRDTYDNFNLMTQELGATEIIQTDFVSNVSHEFKTPINAIEGYATLLQSGSQSSDQAMYVDKILLNTRRLNELVSNILLLSRVDNQAISTNRTRFRLDEQIRQAIVLLEPKWSEKELDLDVDLETLEYAGSESLLLHVWMNLIDNAIKYDPYGGLLRLRLNRRADSIVFTVEDSGPGIAPEAQKHIFDKFYQADSSRMSEGNGLGLALVKRVLDVCSGAVYVENLPEAGCRFTVTLPPEPIS
jgi:signal transduction histidine kinase